MLVILFVLLQSRILCSHCPVYADKKRTVKCWGNISNIRLWQINPGPMTDREKLLLRLIFFLFYGYPLIFILFQHKWGWLFLYGITFMVLSFAMKRLLCAKCLNFVCPFNSVDAELKERMISFTENISHKHCLVEKELG